MKRPRGNKTSKTTREMRRSTVVEALQESPNLTNQQLADETGVSLRTVKRDLAELRERFANVTDERYTEFKKVQLAMFELIERNLVEGSVTPEVAREWRGIRSEISQLLGLNAPSRSISATISTPSDPMYLKFREAVWNLQPDQIHEVLVFAKNMPRLDTSKMSNEEWLEKYGPKRLTGENNADSESPNGNA